MKIILFIFLSFFCLGCKEKIQRKKVYDKHHNLKNVYEIKGDIITIYDYATNGKLMMKLKFKQDQFIDTIYYYDFKNHFITIDSSKGKYFYGTETVILNNGKYGYKGGLRFKKNTSPQIASQSRLRFGRHVGANEDGSINDDIDFKIIGDSSYIYDVRIKDRKHYD